MLAYPDHHSASSIKLWRKQPKVWCAKYLFPEIWKDLGAAFMWRGSAVERGFETYLLGGADPLAEAHSIYLQKTGGEVNDEIEEEKQLIEPMLNQAIAWHKTTNLKLAAKQIPIQTTLDGVERPFVGWVDFAFMNDCDMDTKTTERCPLIEPLPDDTRQVSIYEKARGRPQSILYITPKKHAWYKLTPERLAAARIEVTKSARSLESFLSMATSREQAINSLSENDFIFKSDKAQLAVMGV